MVGLYHSSTSTPRKWFSLSGWPTLSTLKGRGFDFSCVPRLTNSFERRNQTLRHFETREGAATLKVKTVSEGAPPADAVKAGLHDEELRDPLEYAGFENLVKRLQDIEAKKSGKVFKPTKQDLKDFFTEESEVVSGKN